MNSSFLLSYIALWGIAIFQGLVLLALLRQAHEINRLADNVGRLKGNELPLGSVAPWFSGRDQRSGRQVDSSVFGESGGIVLFLASHCSVCKQLVNSLSSSLGNLPPVVCFCVGHEGLCFQFMKRLHHEIPVVLDQAEALASRYGASGFPTAVVLDREQKIVRYAYPRNSESLVELWESLSAEKEMSGTKAAEPVLGRAATV